LLQVIPSHRLSELGAGFNIRRGFAGTEDESPWFNLFQVRHTVAQMTIGQGRKRVMGQARFEGVGQELGIVAGAEPDAVPGDLAPGRREASIRLWSKTRPLATKV
jgi:hypothetical protein